MLFEKGSELVPCVNGRSRELKRGRHAGGSRQRWLSDVVDVPVLK